MKFEVLNDDLIRWVRSLVKNSRMPNLFNRFVAMACWLEDRPIYALYTDQWIMLVSVGEIVELMNPLGSYSREDMAAAVTLMREKHPEKTLWVYGIDDDSIEYFDKEHTEDVQMSYVLSVEEISSQQSKKLRNAVSKITKEGVEVRALNVDTKADAKKVLSEWAVKKVGSGTSFQEHLFEEFLLQEEDPGQGLVLYINGVPLGVTYLVQDAAFPEYALVLVNVSARSVNGVSEYLLWCAATHAKDAWNCKYLNYGGADPKEEARLHSFKKKFGWKHILMEYGLKYEPLNKSPDLKT